MVTNCFGGISWGDLEGLFLRMLLPLLEVVLPMAHLMTHTLFLKAEKRARERESLSIFPR
jgi:hypothetical protein